MCLMTKNKITTIAVTLLAVSTLTACGTTENKITAPSTAPAATAEAPAASAESAKQDDSAEENKVHKFGETAKLGKSLEITVKAPEEFKPGEFAIDIGEKTEKLPAVKMQISLKNTSDKSLDINGFGFNATISSGGKVTDTQILDPENGVAMPKAEFTLDPGTSYDYAIAYRVQDPKAITYRMKYTPNPAESPLQAVFSTK